jgi:RNA polymerase sigma-70 factor (ECF subfamily)
VEANAARAARLYREHGAVVYRRCLRLLKNADAARDATQEVFMKLVRNLDRLEDRPELLPWLYRVATNHCLNVLRNRARRGETSDAAQYELHANVTPDTLPERHLARQILSRFDEETGAIAVGVLVDGMEQEELAQTLGISRRTVARKLERFLDQARKYAARSAA